MKKKIIYLVIILILSIICLWFIIDKNKTKEKKNITSNKPEIRSNIESNTNSNEESNSNIESNLTSNEESNSNSNPTIESNITSQSNNVQSQSNSNNQKTSNSNKKSNSNNVSNSNSQSQSNKPSNPTGLKTNGKFIGVYSDSNVNMIVYQIDNILRVNIHNLKTNNVLKPSCTVSGTSATCNSSNLKLKLNDTSITYTSDNSSFSNYTVQKTKEYTNEDFYKDWIKGDINYFNNEYNGIYTASNGTIKLYQFNSTDYIAIMNINKKETNIPDDSVPNVLTGTITLHKEGNMLVGTSNKGGNIKISISNGKIHVESENNSNIRDVLYHASGDYTRSSKYSLEALIRDWI